MNKRENNLVVRFQGIIQDIPLPTNGATWTKSADVSGFISYSKDMAACKPVIQNAIYHIRIGEYEEADRDLTLLERYIQLRQSQDWGFVSNHPTIRDIEWAMEQEQTA